VIISTCAGEARPSHARDRRCELEAPSESAAAVIVHYHSETDGTAFNASRAPTSRTRLTVRMNALDDPATAALHNGSIPVSAAEGVEARHLPACPTPELRRHYIASSARAVTSIVADYRATAGIDLDMDRTDRAAGRQLGRPVGVPGLG
jgi:hypothetical protein